MIRRSAVLPCLAISLLLGSCQVPGSGTPLLGASTGYSVEQYPANADWMEENQSFLRKLTLTEAVLPGTHDAGTYGITEDSEIAPDLAVADLPVGDDDSLRDLKNLLVQQGSVEPLNRYLALWAKAQGVPIKTQLENGIRYFDLRPVMKPLNPAKGGRARAPFVAHSLYASELEPMIDQVAAFVERFPKEVVFLDLSHFTDLTPADHQQLVGYIKLKLGPELIPAPAGATAEDPKGNSLTFKDVWATGKQVVCFYQTGAVEDPLLWRWGIPSGTKWWPHKSSTAEVKTFLSHVLDVERPLLPAGSFFVLQTVLTADVALYEKAIPKAATMRILNEGKAELEKLQKQWEKYKKGVSADSTKIAENDAEIKRLKRKIDNEWWNVKDNPGRWVDIYKLGRKNVDLLADIAKDTIELKNAKESIDKLLAKIPELETALKSFSDVPGSLQELANQGNDAMLGWIWVDWAKKPLNIVIVDWAEETDVVDRCVLLNRKRPLNR